ncbi:ornithine carbamoyltransferase [Buchnera aphidicola (Chaitoregma tattakana)]|uniref:ornithine carbamoyltransferase n=1 Tax=Buchnera aphidicola TaxID=9 RepID=UPI0031B82922
MQNFLYQRSLLSLKDLNKFEIETVLNTAKKLKKLKKEKKEKKFLKNKKIISIFESNSTRTRCAFETSAFDQGLHITNLDINNTHMNEKESIEDTVKVFNIMYDGIQYRGPKHEIILDIQKYAKIPVWNGLTNKFHPIQILSDLMTIKENIKKNNHFNDITLAYIGDCKNNIANTILEASYIIGININMISHEKFLPNIEKIKFLSNISNKENGKILCTENVYKGLNNVDFIYTDTWLSMHENYKNLGIKIKLLEKYQLNEKLLTKTNSYSAKILHCMPSIHDNNTIISKKIFKKYKIKNGLEITNDVFNSKNSLVFNQVENKVHIIKALMLLNLKKNINL